VQCVIAGRDGAPEANVLRRCTPDVVSDVNTVQRIQLILMGSKASLEVRSVSTEREAESTDAKLVDHDVHANRGGRVRIA
jgi:hypothetical protein